MDLCAPYVLKRHRKLPADQRPTWWFLQPTADQVQQLREELAVPTGAASDGSSEGAARRPVEIHEDFGLRMAARYLRRVDHLHDPEGQEISFTGLDEAARLVLLRRVVPVRVVNELATVAAGDLDKEEERTSSGSGAT